MPHADIKGNQKPRCPDLGLCISGSRRRALECTLDMVTKAGRVEVGRQARALTGWQVVPLVRAVPVATSQITTFCSGTSPADSSQILSAEKLRACNQYKGWDAIWACKQAQQAGVFAGMYHCLLCATEHTKICIKSLAKRVGRTANPGLSPLWARLMRSMVNLARHHCCLARQLLILVCHV